MNETTETPIGFQEFCDSLQDSYDFLAVHIRKTRSTEWVAKVYKNHHEEELLACGEGETIEAAGQNAIKDYYDREREKVEKEKALNNPEVLAALKLFKIDITSLK